jgi:hypothetical protein
MESLHSYARHLCDSEISYYSRLDFAAQGPLTSRLDAHRRDVTADKISPKFRTFLRRDGISGH